MPADNRIHISLPHSLVTGILITVALGLISTLDYLTGYELSFVLFYYAPIALAAWRHGARAGLLTAVLATICWYSSRVWAGGGYSNQFIAYWNAGMRLGCFSITAIVMGRLAEEMKRL